MTGRERASKRVIKPGGACPFAPTVVRPSVGRCCRGRSHSNTHRVTGGHELLEPVHHCCHDVPTRTWARLGLGRRRVHLRATRPRPVAFVYKTLARWARRELMAWAAAHRLRPATVAGAAAGFKVLRAGLARGATTDAAEGAATEPRAAAGRKNAGTRALAKARCSAFAHRRRCCYRQAGRGDCRNIGQRCVCLSVYLIVCADARSRCRQAAWARRRPAPVSPLAWPPTGTRRARSTLISGCATSTCTLYVMPTLNTQGPEVPPGGRVADVGVRTGRAWSAASCLTLLTCSRTRRHWRRCGASGHVSM
jgi:hypothetical protein